MNASHVKGITRQIPGKFPVVQENMLAD